MCSNSAPSPYKISASTEASDGYVWYAYRGFADDDGDTWWMANTSTGWLKIDFGSDNSATLRTYKIQVNNQPEPNRAPKAWTVQGSNNDSDWTTIDTVTSQTSWGNAEVREFTCDDTSTAYRYFRINITENNGDAKVQVALWEMYGTSSYYPPQVFPPWVMTSDNTPSGVVSASTEVNAANMAYKAFDGNTESKWTTDNVTTGWLAYEHTSVMDIRRYDVTGPISGQETMAPKNWTFEGYDGEDWVVLDTQTNQTDWSAAEVRSFNLSGLAQYTKVRINITENNGHANLLSIVELKMRDDLAP